MTEIIDKSFEPALIEKNWYQSWENAGYFSPQSTGDQAYCIMIPPPNVTGSLHMGHAFQDTIMDALVRYHRMQNKATLWQVGTDHAGIATQMVVERQCEAHGLSRKALGREAFVEKIWQWKQGSGGTITQQLRRLGASVDWDTERFTLDEGLSAAVRQVFVKLYDEGLIYRGKRLVNWDPSLQTAVSDLEVVNEEQPGHLWHLRYPLKNGSGFLVVATTRPETLLGDVAVAVHPEDERYQKLIGQELQLPLTDRTIPILADEMVDQEFGSGCVKITPAHDFNDYALGQRHQLPLINILQTNGHLNEEVPEPYRGLSREQARNKVLADLEALNLIEKIEAHTLHIPKGEKTGAILEPYLTDQWFVKIAPLAKPAITAVETGQIKFIPENWSKTYFEWMHNIQDWCISRQLWWGHRIPAWFDTEGKIYVGNDEAEIRSKYKLAPEHSLEQDPDVLDTWFSSALWPFSTLGWPEQTERLKTFYPTQVLVTGFDIIFFWVARMIMFGLKFTGEVPFKEIYIHGLIQDENGQKMSKSKGNVIDPIDLIDGIDLASLLKKRSQGLMQPAMAKQIEKKTQAQFPAGIPAYGTDALRFTFCSLATTGRHIRFDLARIGGYRNFCNKLWNAARYVLMNCDGKEVGTTVSTQALDRWIVSIWQDTKKRIHEHFAAYRFDLIAQVLYDFIWNEYCDWYLELSKPLLNDAENQAQAPDTRFTLVSIYEEILRSLHPLMPFITEELWQKIAPLCGKQGPTVMLAPYPHVEISLIHTDAIQQIEWLKKMILAIRTIRGEMNVAPSKKIPLLLQKGTAEDKILLEKELTFFQALAKLESITWLSNNDTPPLSATALVGSLELMIPLAGIIDVSQEVQRLEKEVLKLKKEFDMLQSKHRNGAYLEKAPATLIVKEKERLAELQHNLATLEQRLQKMHAMA